MVGTYVLVSHVTQVIFLFVIYSFKSSNSLSLCTVAILKQCLLYFSMMHYIIFTTCLFANKAITQQCINPICCNMAVKYAHLFTKIISISRSIFLYAFNITFGMPVTISERFNLLGCFVLFPFYCRHSGTIYLICYPCPCS